MNKKDCDEIGYILSCFPHSDKIREAIFLLDERIEPKYLMYEFTQGRDERVRELFEQKLEQTYGPNWCMLKAVTKKVTKSVMAEARKEIYGDDYHPSLFA